MSQMLSLPEDWDYTLAGLSHINREKIDAIREAVRELERAGYIVRSRERDAKGRLRGADYVIYEQPQLPPKPDFPTLENPTLENPTQENPTLEKPTQENPMQLNKEVQRTNLSKKEKSNTDTQSTHSIPILSPDPSPLEKQEATANGSASAAGERKRKEPDDAYRVYEEILKDNICYDILGDDYPAELVKSKFMKLDSEHIRFVLDCMRENTTKIRNIKQYLRAALFNAPSTIGNYYTSLVAHDMASGALAPRKPRFGDPDYYSCNEGESL